MNFLHIEGNDKKNYKLTILKVALPFSYVFKMWLTAELIFNSINLAGIFGRIIAYCISGLVGFGLAALAVSWSYNSFWKSKYSPCDLNCNCKINKLTYTAITYFVICVINVIGGLLNFIAYTAPVSITFITILMPTLLSIIAICGIITMMYFECEKGDLKQLITSMALPSILFLLLLR